ncbi:hypothetical protein LJC04_05125 [Ruminococcaceae bacterium OttesenSCG-928-O06]|nr:hypothetical protein [Ruminococcaceae bacterium OttesenSCG-928-O06]
MQDSFDRMVDTAGRMADAAVKTTASLVNKGRDKAEQVALQAKLAKLHRQLGALVYALHKSGEENDEMVQWYIREMDSVHRKLADLQQPPAEEEIIVATPAAKGAEDDGDAMFRGGDGEQLP